MSARGGTENGEFGRLADGLAASLVDAAPDGMIAVDAEGRIVIANPMVDRLFGYERGSLVGLSVDVLVPEHLRTPHEVHRSRYSSEPAVRGMGTGMVLEAVRCDGSTFSVEISLSPVTHDGAALTVAIVRDVTERREADAALSDANQTLELIRDRERIARDLHDIVIQRLFAAGMMLQSAASQSADPATTVRIADVIDQLDGTIRDIRTSVFRLGNRRAAIGGLRDRIVAIVEEAARPLGFEPHIRFDGLLDAAVPDAIADDTVAITREALSNCVRHADASNVVIDLTIADDALRVQVTDDGRGIDDEATLGSGVRNIQTRAEHHGGTASIQANASGGTSVVWEVPLETVRV